MIPPVGARARLSAGAVQRESGGVAPRGRGPNLSCPRNGKRKVRLF